MLEEFSVSSSSNEKFLGYFENVAMLRNWIEEEAKQQHHNVSNTAKFPEEIEPSKNFS
jgi:hypothetical protein